MTDETLKQMHADMVRHEAGHAVAALLTGLRVGAVHAPPLPAVPPDDLDRPAGRTLVERKGDRRAHAIVLLAGPLSEGRPAPAWPIRPSRYSDDERQLARLVGEEDELTYLEIVADAERLVASEEFVALHAVVGELLSHQPHHLGEEQLEGIKAATSIKQRTMGTVGRSTFAVEVKALEPDDDRWRSRALDNLGADLAKALNSPAMRKALEPPQVQIATFEC